MLITNLSPITEAYFGKTKELIKAEQALNQLVNIINQSKTGTLDSNAYATILQKILHESTGRKLLKTIEESFRNQFGFKSFTLYISREFSGFGPNAFTVQGVITYAGTSGFHNPIPLEQAKQYYDAKHEYDCVVFITAVLLGMANLTANELIGLILHEIGHNFQCTPLANIGHTLPLLQIFRDTLRVAKFPTFHHIARYTFKSGISLFGNTVFKMFGDACNKLNEMTPKKDRMQSDKTIFEIVKTMLKINAIPFLLPAFSVYNTTTSLMSPNILDLMDSICGYSGEVFADSFAVAYGYGPGLSSGLNKLEYTCFIKYNDLATSNTPVKYIYELSALTMEIVMCVYNLDPHPTTQKRIMNNMDKLEREIKSADMPPQLKKKAISDLKYNKEVYQEYLSAKAGTNKLVLLSIFRHINDCIGGNFDYRALINKILNLGMHSA